MKRLFLYFSTCMLAVITTILTIVAIRSYSRSYNTEGNYFDPDAEISYHDQTPAWVLLLSLFLLLSAVAGHFSRKYFKANSQKSNKIEVGVLLLFIYTESIIAAFLFEEHYRTMIRLFFKLFNGSYIIFVGKGFHLFASFSFVNYFGLFSVLLFLLIYRKKRKALRIILILVLFFFTTAVSTFMDSKSSVAVCTACKDGILRLNYNSISYDLHFIISLIAAISPLALAWLLERRKKVNPLR